ncbi:TonB-dependent receptor [Paraglaciecola arctica]|uniref:TonB-dependent receptor n=1 Tax=Paraglaciecola arctica TaxID=1128911 RepID=UPI001C0762CE|nr:TonB-dependent receptor [Paraglaciecola arctica]MBU3003920.1 TonB-dependent receptor [Paraglaciecola arctica]
MNRKISILSAAVCLAMSIPVSAQIDENAENEASRVEVIQITSTKRTKTLQEVPVAVSVTTSETIEKAQIQDVKDLQTIVPSLRVTQLQSSGNTNFVIRGFGNGANNPGIEPSVGVFIDGVYRSRSAAALSDLPRLDRVEVLRGPQSTLFGKNASAGVISIVTPKPSGSTGGYILAGLGNYGFKNVKGLFESAISDELTFDVSGSINKRDGWFENLETGTDMNNVDRWSARGQMVYEPTETAEFRFIADASEMEEICCGIANAQSGPATESIRAVGGDIVENDVYARENYLDIDPVNKIESSGASLQADIEFDTFTLTSITSLRSNDNFFSIDTDFSGADIVNGRDKVETDTFTQELRITSNNNDSNLEWMIGGFFFDEDVSYQSSVRFGTEARAYFDERLAPLSALTGGAPPLAVTEAAFSVAPGTLFGNEQGVTEYHEMQNEAFSLFGQFDYHLSDDLTATLGLNYSNDEKSVNISQDNDDSFSALPLTGTPFEAIAGLQVFPSFLDVPNEVESGKTDDSETTYTARLSYKLNRDISVYGSVGTGFKASSWNLTRDSRPFSSDMSAIVAAGIAPLNLTSGTRYSEPEKASVIELGLKARFDVWSLNLALFDQKIEDFQANIFVGTGFVLSNATEQSTKGLEFDFTYYPLEGLRLGLAGTLLDPVYDSFEGGNGPDGPTDLSGMQPSGVSETNLSASATYSFYVGDWDAYISGDYQYDSEVQSNDNVSADIASREVKQLNLSAGATSEDDLTVSVWLRNATDEDYLLSAFPAPVQTGTFNAYPSIPRTFGVSVKKAF